LDYDPTHPKNPTNLARYIRKFRKDKGLLIREFAEEIGILKFTLIKWEWERIPQPRYLKRLIRLIPGLDATRKDLYSKNVR
jgi:DNA-binding transcriptional regulator YiaG